MARLAIGSKASLSVFDLLSDTMVWTKAGQFVAFAAAEDDHSLSVNGREVWLAASRLGSESDEKNANIVSELRYP